MKSDSPGFLLTHFPGTGNQKLTFNRSHERTQGDHPYFTPYCGLYQPRPHEQNQFNIYVFIK